MSENRDMGEPREPGGTLPTDPSQGASGSPGPQTPRAEPAAAIGSARYERLQELGRGGMGVVYRVHDRVLRRDVAMKLLPDHGSVKSDARQRFQTEARAVAALKHPNIVDVYDVGTLPPDEGNLLFYTMELLDGEDMQQAIKAGRLTSRDAVEVTRQIAQALSYAHHRGILHRDVKPHNILLS